MTRRDLLILGLASTTLLGAGPAEDAARGTIYLYASGRDAATGKRDQGIFALDPARTTWTRIAGQSDSAALDTAFRVSPDGRFLALKKLARKDGGYKTVGIIVRDLAHEGAIRELSAVPGRPIWSADGKRLVVVVGKGDVPGTNMPNHETWMLGADDSGPRKLPIPETDQVDDWSPDGSWFLAGSHRDPGVGYQIYRIRPDGSEPRRLTATGKGILNLDGRISPDGRRVAYWRVGDAQAGVWVMDADGTNPRRLFETTADELPQGPAWSPDGRKLAIAVHAKRADADGAERYSQYKLILLDLAGGDPVRIDPPLTDLVGNPQWAPSWKP